jgi:Pentapeptide repeats (8 copies)
VCRRHIAGDAIAGFLRLHDCAFLRAMLSMKGATMKCPRLVEDPAYQCLRADDPRGFHKLINSRQEVDFSDTDLRGVDLRSADLSKVVLRGAYLRDADLRGQDLRHMDLEGCSLFGARISGTYFPDSISPQEIANSVQYGTRLRTRA